MALIVRRLPSMERASSPSDLSALLYQHDEIKPRLADCSSFRRSTPLVRFLQPHLYRSGATKSAEECAADAGTLLATSDREVAVAIFAAQIAP